MKIALIQLDLAWEDVEENHRRARRRLEEAKGRGAGFALLPEMFSTGFSMDSARIAQPPGGPSDAFLRGVARELSMWILASVPEAGEPRPRNMALLAAPDGSVSRYAKIHPFTFGGEHRVYEGGDRVLTARVGDVAVTPFVCYDLRFPEIFRHAVRKGAQLYTVIANWPEPREAHWLALLKARAIENQAFVIGVNRCGRDPKLAYSGRGQILDPRGNVLADGGNQEGVFGAEIDPGLLLTYRKEFPALQDLKFTSL